MRRFNILIIIFLKAGILSGQERTCYIAINSNSCFVCRNSYVFISKINSELNPTLVFNREDSTSAEYFVREVLHLGQVPFIVNDSLYQTLVRNYDDLQLQLYTGKTLVYEAPVKQLSMHINELNNYASQPLTETLARINTVFNSKFIGRTRSFIINEYLALYSELTRYFLYSDFRTGRVNRTRLDDSMLLSYVYDPEQFNTIKDKRKFYLDNIGSITETELSSFVYYKDFVYLVFNVLDYPKMKTAEEVIRNNNETEFYYKNFLIELKVSDSLLVKNRIMDMTQDNLNMRRGFSIIENQPVLFFKNSRNNTDSFSYFPLEHSWVKKHSPQPLSKYFSGYIMENVFFNEYVHNYDQNILINNRTKQTLKIYQGDLLMNMVLTGGSLIPIRNFVYFNVLDKKKSKHHIYRVNTETGNIQILNSFNEQDAFGFFPIFYWDESINTLYILDINDNKKFYIVDTLLLTD